MERELGLTKAREKFSDLVEQVQFQGDTFLISRNGKPAVAIVPIEIYESWKRERIAFFDIIRQSQKITKLTGEESESLATETVQAMRAEI